jgi:hypothetical protein
MSLRDAVLSRGIIRRSINRAHRPLAGHAALELTSYVLGAALFQRIGTPTRNQRERAKNRQGFHLLMLRSDRKNARRVEAVKRCSGACIKRRSK